MNTAAISKSILVSIELWLRCVFNPFLVLSKIPPRSTGLSKSTFRLLLCSTMLTTTVMWPVFRLYGIRWNDFGFQIPNMIVTDLSIMFEGVSLYLMLRVHGSRCKFWVIFEAQMIIAAAYAPAVSLMSIPAEMKLLQFEAAESAKHISMAGLMRCFITPGCASSVSAKGPLPNILSTLSTITAGAYLVLLAEYLVTNLKTAREEVYSAVGCSVVLSFLFWLAVFYPFRILNEFSAIQSP